MSYKKIFSTLFLVGFVLLFAASYFFLTSGQALARAGGGQNYVAPSSNNGGGNFSSSGGGSSDFLLFYLLGSLFSSEQPGSKVMGVIIVIVIIIVWSYLKKNKGKIDTFTKEYTPPTTPFAGQGAPSPDLPAELNRLSQKDPIFNEQAFKDFVQNSFYKIQEAWEKADLKIARPYLTDQLMQRYSTQLDDLKSRGEKNILENIVIGHMTLTKVHSDNKYDYITVKIDASCADYTVNAKGELISGSKQAAPFTEYWTFLRKGDIKTNPKKSFKANTCPNCGAPLQLNATGQCEYCNTIVTSGDYDWVLSEIEQAN